MWYHIKSKHDVFSDFTEQKCLRFAQMSFWDGTANLQRKGFPFPCNTVEYAWRLFAAILREILAFQSSDSETPRGLV